jgi:UPF0716 protein FxsA
MKLLLTLAFLFIVVPWLEIVLLLAVADALGFFSMIGIVLLTGFVGAGLARQQGLQALMKVRQAAGQGRVPSNEIFDGVCILCAGLLLLTPGLLTDGVGFLLLLPPGRTALRKFLLGKLQKGVSRGSLRVVFGGKGHSPRASRSRASSRGADVIDVKADTIGLSDD